MKKVVATLSDALKNSESVRRRRNLVWTLSRINSKQAKIALRTALSDPDGSARQAAAHSAGVLRDEGAAEHLRKLLREDTAPLRRTAAIALGAIGDRVAVPSLLEVLARDDNDEFLSHAITHSLIEIGDSAALRRALTSKNPRVRRAAALSPRLEVRVGSGRGGPKIWKIWKIW